MMTVKFGIMVIIVLGLACGCTAARAPARERTNPGVQASVQGPPDPCARLSPVMSRRTDDNWGFAKAEAVLSATLFSRVPVPTDEKPEVEDLFMVMVKEDPRSTPQAVYILQTPNRPEPREYRVVHVTARERVLFRVEPVESDATEAPLDAELAGALEQSWGSMALGARWPDREGSIDRMRGGSIYTFDYRGDNVYGQGDTVSPDPGTCLAALVSLGELLMRYADERDETKRRTIREELLRESRVLAVRLRRP